MSRREQSKRDKAARAAIGGEFPGEKLHRQRAIAERAIGDAKFKKLTPEQQRAEWDRARAQAIDDAKKSGIPLSMTWMSQF